MVFVRQYLLVLAPQRRPDPQHPRCRVHGCVRAGRLGDRPAARVRRRLSRPGHVRGIEVTAFVILAAGPGTRMGRYGGLLHKALLPLAGRAVISHQIALAPADARVIVCTGCRAAQVRDYTELAHPDREVTFVPVDGWDRPAAGQAPRCSRHGTR